MTGSIFGKKEAAARASKAAEQLTVSSDHEKAGKLLRENLANAFPDRVLLSDWQYADYIARMEAVSEIGLTVDQISDALAWGVRQTEMYGPKLITMVRFKYDKRNLGGELRIDSLYENFYASKISLAAGANPYGLISSSIEDMSDGDIINEVFEEVVDQDIALAFRQIMKCFSHTKKITTERLSCLVAITETLFYSCMNQTTWVGDVPCRATIGKMDAINEFCNSVKSEIHSITTFRPGSDVWKVYVSRIIIERFDPMPDCTRDEYLSQYADTPLEDVAKQYVNTELFDWI